ncbi:DUF7344 domain-containing protein [Haloplanus aerogenes]|uniref:DUF7344 domain-containing protein n=1 Tax=Haloplanus aerogenes TaxID=660522 RepID=A0A3M0CTK2_9EURY|nr:hypothetical protein [Haloplanus aerogenes]AZH26583.1 hypothetical protein DU502_14910 [Haloplanus aerogenes]RMB12814.1 hypothetical protein ATH50_2969 [Haloplanus aerogenes]
MWTHAADDAFRALADEKRRLVVRYLVNDDEGVASYEEVIDYVASRCSVGSERASIALRHSILPTLAETDLLRYDHDAERIRYRPNELVEDALRVVDGA